MNACDNEQVFATLYDHIKEAGTLTDDLGADHENYDIHFGKPMINALSINSIIPSVIAWRGITHSGDY